MTLLNMPGCGPAGADAGEVLLGDLDGLVHLLLGLEERLVDHVACSFSGGPVGHAYGHQSPYAAVLSLVDLSPACTSVPILSPRRAAAMLPSPSMAKTTIGRLLSMHRLNAVGVDDLQAALQGLAVGDLSNLRGVRVLARVGVVDPVDPVLAHQHRVALDLQGALGRDRVGGEERHAGAGAEDDDPALLEVADRPAAGCTARRPGPS